LAGAAQGKTLVLLNDAFDLANDGESVAIFTIEMSVLHIAQRIMKMAGTDDPSTLPHIRLVQLSCVVALSDLVQAIKLAPENVIILDYLGVISIDRASAFISQYDVMFKVCDTLRQLSKDEGKCIITASQLSRTAVTTGEFNVRETELLKDLKFKVIKKLDDNRYQIGDTTWKLTEQLTLCED
jgi:predicted ATP-dependent serine protease